MVTTGIIILSLSLGLLLVIAGAFLKDKATYLALFGSVLLVITGIVLLISPLEFITGTTTEIIGSVTTETNIYAPQSVAINTIMSFVILFIGLMGVYLGASDLYERKYDDPEDDYE
jgi:hypothetical protein